jgi:hypothetical protein
MTMKASRQRVRASNQINIAIMAGKLRRPSACESCGQVKAMICGSPADLEHPVESVRWLCMTCIKTRRGLTAL